MTDELREKIKRFENQDNSVGPCVEKAAHPPLMLELRHRGNRTALPYNLLLSVEFNPSRHLEIQFSTGKVILQSTRPKSLEPLVDLLKEHLVARLDEIDEVSASALDAVPIITKINVEPRN